MRIRNIIIVLLIGFSIAACNTNGDNNEKNTGFIAKIDSTQTLTQIAKANNIGEPFLRTKLGVPDKIGKSYTITKLAKHFKFSIDDLRKIIEDQKNKQAAARLKKQEVKK